MNNYFSDDELRCKCGCDQILKNEMFLKRLNTMRELASRPLHLSSAYRCPNHPVEARKKKGGSHTFGRAVDIICKNGCDFYELLPYAIQVGFTGLGLHLTGTARFLHLDDLTKQDGFSRPTIWGY